MNQTLHTVRRAPRRKSRRGGALSLAVAYAAVLFAPFAAPSVAQEQGIAIDGTWRPTTLSGTASASNAKLYADPVARVLYSYHTTGWLAAYDLDSLAPLGSGISAPGTFSGAVADPITSTLFIAFAERSQASSRVVQYGMTPEGVRQRGQVNTSSIGTGQEVFGMYRSPDKPVLWLFSTTQFNATNPTLSELEIPGYDVARGTLRWSKPLTGCSIAMKGNPELPIGFGYVPEQRALYFGCGNPSGFDGTVNTPVVRGAARLTLRPGTTPNSTAPGDVEFFPTPGVFSTAASHFDPVSRRLLFSTYAPSVGAGSAILLFDTVTNSYVGSFATGGNQLEQEALEPVSGRFYALSRQPSTGMVVTDVRATPARQGYGFPAYSTMAGKAPIKFAPAVDPVSGRMFVKYDGMPDFVIFRDTIPWYSPLEGDDPDRNTVNAPEEDGKTTALYSAAGQGYGSRQRQVGGIEALFLIGNVSYPVGAGTREVRTSYLDGMSVTNGEASAAAITADRDRENTAADASHLPSGDPWPYGLAHCVDFGNEAKEDVDATTTVSCAAGDARVAVASSYEDGDMGGVFVGETTLQASGRRDAKKGAVSTVTSTAKGISVLGGVIQIGEVSATAQAFAKGRPGTAGTTYIRTVKNVKLQGSTVCEKECNINDLARQVNAQFVGRIRIDIPNPDPVGAAGSDGGYQALLRRAPFEQLQEQVLNGQPPDRIELPALVITVYEDGNKSARTIVELAATEAEARYGIALLGDGGDFGGGSAGGDGGIETLDAFGDLGTALAGDSPIFGLDPTTATPSARLPMSSGGRGIDGELASAGGLIWNGIKGTLKLLPVWAVLLLPIYLSARRWLLLQRDALVDGGTS